MASKRGTLQSSVYNLVATMVGGGTLSVPYAFKQAGMITALFLFLIISCASAQSLFLLIACKKFCDDIRKKRRRDADSEEAPLKQFYDDNEQQQHADIKTLSFYRHDEEEEVVDSLAALAFEAYGKTARFICTILLILVLYLTLVAYFILLGDLLPPIIHRAIPSAIHYTIAGRVALTGFAALIMTPVCSLQDISSFRFVSGISLFSSAFLAFCVTFRSVEHMGSSDPVPDGNGVSNIVWFRWGTTPLTSIVLISLSYLCHFNAVSVRNEICDSSRKNIRNVVLLASVLPLIIYCTVGIFGYLHFRDGTMQDVLVNYSDSDTLLIVAHGTLSLTICLSIPLLVYPFRITLKHLLPTLSFQNHVLWRLFQSCLIVAAAYGFSTFITNVVVVWSFCGATIGITCMFIFPPLFYLQLRNKRNGWTSKRMWLADKKGISSVMLLCAGIVGFILCTYQAIMGVV